MILYNKNTEFLGASAEILSILGYEDINAFKAYNNDIADLFVNKQGYVHKFENFSWINYVLNGSLPNKNVIIKTRNSGEIESEISICEIFLSGSNDKYFIVNLSNIRHLSNDATQNIQDKQPIFKIQDEATESVDIKPFDFTKPTETTQFTDTFIKPIEIINNTEDTFLDKPQDTKISFSFSEEDIQPYANSTQNSTENDEQIDDKKDLPKEPNQNDAIDIKIDLQEISDVLGISNLDVVNYLKEYLSYLEENVYQLRKLYVDGNTPQTKRIVINLIGIGSNLRAKEIVQILQKLLIAGAGTSNFTALNDLEKNVLAFKQAILNLSI